jgi:hypothetical protein
VTDSTLTLTSVNLVANHGAEFPTISSGSGDRLVRSSGDWSADGFSLGDTITLSGTTSHNGSFTISGLSASTLTLSANTTGTDEGPRKVTLVDGGDAITRQTGDWSADGFTVGQTITVGDVPNGSGHNNSQFTIAKVTPLTLTLTVSHVVTAEGPESKTIGSPASHDQHSLIKATDLPLTTGGNSMDGKTFYVIKMDDDHFQLAAMPGGGALPLGVTAGATGNHKIGPEAVDIDVASGDQFLRIDLSGGVDTTHGPQVLEGPGGTPLNVVSPPTGDGVSSVTSNGSGGGFVGVGTNDASITENPTVNASLSASLATAGGKVSITGSVTTNTTASAQNGTGGFVGIGDASTHNNQSSDNEVSVGEKTRIIATKQFILSAVTDDSTSISTRATGGGAVGVASASATSDIDYKTIATVNKNADVLAGDTLTVSGESRTSQSANAHASGLGFGADGHAHATTNIGSGATTVEVDPAAALTGRAVVLSAKVTKLYAHAHSEAYGAGVYSEGIDTANVDIHAANNVTVHDHAAVTGYEGVDFITKFDNVDTESNSFARSTGLFGYVSSDSTNDTHMDSSVKGWALALVTAGPRDETGHLAFNVDTSNGAVSANNPHDSSKRSLAAGGDDGHGGNAEPTAGIDFDSDVTILSGRSPLLEIDDGGNIKSAVNVSVDDSAGGGPSNRTSGHIQSDTIVVKDISNDDPGQVYFNAHDHINGSGGKWTFIDTFQQVRIINNSKKPLQVGTIQVVNTTQDPIVNLLNTVSLGLVFNIFRIVAPTLIDIESFNPDPPDIVLAGKIENPLGTTRIVNMHAGITSKGSRSDADADPTSLIRTNILDLETPEGSIGQSGARVNVDVVDSAHVPQATNFISARVSDLDGSIYLGRNQFFTGELVLYHTNGAVLGNLMNDNYYVVIASDDGLHIQLASIDTPTVPIMVMPTATPTDSHALTPAQRFTVKAGHDFTTGLGDAYLDVKARRRDDPGTHQRLPLSVNDFPITDYSVIIDAVTTAGNADIKLWGSVTETSVTGTTYPNGIPGHAGGVFVEHDGGGEEHFTYFRPPPPEAPAPGLDPGMFADITTATHINSTYDLREFDTAGNLWRPGITAGRNIILSAAESTAVDPKIVNIYGITEIVGGGSAASGDQHHINVLTNGYITLREKTDDLRVGSITSTGSPTGSEPHSGDVTLFSPAAIIDAQNDAAADVTGRNITMTAGDSQITGKAMMDKSGRGGIGTPGNFLEINEDANGNPLGVVNAFDTASDTTSFVKFPHPPNPPFDPTNSGTLGVFLTETSGDMQIDTVNTKGDVSLATVAGSLVDARKGGIGDDAANLIGNTINLFAAGGNIGNPNGNNDLEIDSQAYAYGTIGARATGSIHLTETLPTTPTSFAPDAQVVLIQALGIAGGDAVGGDARFTVREGPTAPQGAMTPPKLPTTKGEDLNLLANEAVLFLENSPEALAHGLVNTPNGSILLRVGDNVNTDLNAQILAGRNIDIYGDFARVNEISSGNPVSDAADPGYGTVMQLHGVLAHGPTANGYQTRLFGNADSDQFFFDQTFLGGNAGTATSPIPGGTSQTIPDGGFGVAGTMSSYSGGSTRAYGSNTPTPTTNGITAPVKFKPDATGDTIARTDGGNFVTDGFAIGDVITVDSGVANDPNNRTYTVTGVAPGVLTLSAKNVVTATTNPVNVKIKDTSNNPFAPKNSDGEDFFVVNQLQSMQYVQTAQATPSSDALTLDGQSGTDTYVVNSTGTHGDVRNYVINVLDTGAPDDGVNNLSVYGLDNNDPAFNGPNGKFDDIFLLRRTSGIPNETGNRPRLYADDSAFVAVLDFDPTLGTSALAQAQASDPTNSAAVRSQSVQRINYDSSINGRLMVFGQGGNDYFAVDDNAATTTLDGGAGNDSFQVGQIYGFQRDGSTHSPSPLGNTFGGSVVTNTDLFPQLPNSLTPQSIYGTVATTRGWLSAGAPRRWWPRAAAATTPSASTATRPCCAWKATTATTCSRCAPSRWRRPTRSPATSCGSTRCRRSPSPG